jgi:hypothetical protein
MAAVLCLTACKPSPKGPSLSEYGAQSEATQRINFEKYIQALNELPLAEALARQDSLMHDAASDSAQWRQALRLQEFFLMDPNSPYRSEELYIPVLESLLTSPFATEEERQHAEWVSPRIRLNRLGTEASDFAYITRDGRPHTLYETIDRRKPAQTLLFFSNPGCPNCKEITEALSADLAIRARIDDGRLLVLNIYPDEDLQAWFDYLPEYPKEWICGYDPDQIIRSDTRYWLRAIPSLYLLDEKKRVVLKDAPLEQVLVYCKQR